MEEKGHKKYWVAFAVDNSTPRPEPTPDTGFLPMYFNASPLVVPAEEGDDALCVFSTEGKAIGYLNQAAREEQASLVPAMPIPLSGRSDFREFFASYPTFYVVVDPEHDAAEDTSVTVEEFLKRLED